MSLLRSLVAGAAALVCVAAAAAPVNERRLLNAAQARADWLTHGRTYDEQRFSPLAAIDQSTVKDLQLAWYFDLDTRRGQEATPLVVDGTLYVTSAWSKVFALDARTGKEQWRFDLGKDAAVKSPGMVYGSPVVHRGRIYLATCNLEGAAARQPTVVLCLGDK